MFANGFSVTGGTFNTLDNVECVYFQNPQGTYEIRVITTGLTGNARPPFDVGTLWQDFALVIDNGEFAAASPVTVALCVDRSSSMQTLGYVDVTRASLRQFVDILRVDDATAVVGFETTAALAYGSPTGSAVTVTGATERDAAKTAVNDLTFTGCTFMGRGLEMARDAVAGVDAGVRKAVVLFSDGFDNKGCDETNPAKPWAVDVAAGLPPDLPVYSCAMGPTSDQSTLEQIATVTDGRYYFMPTIDDLREIYNFIRGSLTSEGIIVNESAAASRSRVRAFVEGCASTLTLGVGWAEPKLAWVDREPRRASEIAIRLVDPRGRVLHPYDAWIHRRIADGHIVFTVADPMPGEWHVEVETARETHTRYTVGGFVESPIRVMVEAPSRAKVGEPVRITVRAFDGTIPVNRLRVKADFTRPSGTVDDVRRRFAAAVKRFPMPRRLRDGKDTDLLRFLARRTDRMRKGGADPLAHIKAPLTGFLEGHANGNGPVPGNGSGHWSVLSPATARATAIAAISEAAISSAAVRLRPGSLASAFESVMLALPADRKPRAWTAEVVPVLPGSYTVRMAVQGDAPRCGGRFQRVELVSFYAE